MNIKPKVLIHVNGGFVTKVTSEIDLDWDYVDWNSVLDKVEIITPKFIDKHKHLLTTEEINILNSVCFERDVNCA